MRMRKKKWAQPYLENHPLYCLPQPEIYKGRWHSLFSCAILHLELGMGKGDYLNQMALMYPDEGFIGVEKDVSCAGVACRKAYEQPKPDFHNKRMLWKDACNVLDWFAEGEVDIIHLNFSDPWPKKYTHKRRLSSAQFLSCYKKILNKQGKVIMKTDNASLFEDSVLSFLEAGFSLQEISVDYRRVPHPEDAITEYEQRFLEEGKPIYRLVGLPMVK